MFGKSIITSSLILLSAAVNALSAQNYSEESEFLRGLQLYRTGIYSGARSVFEKISDKDSRAEGYAILCAIKTKAFGYQNLVRDYTLKHSGSAMSGLLYFNTGLNLFDEMKYSEAAEAFSHVQRSCLSKEEANELLYKTGYCYFAEGNFAGAKSVLSEFDTLPGSDYTAPAFYSLAYIEYEGGNFPKAIRYFKKAAEDYRFQEASLYYVLECRFRMKDYDYVISKGPDMLEIVPEERRAHLSRVLSESFLVKGNARKAKEYYQKYAPSREGMSREDRFYAGFMYFSAKDYHSAIDNYVMMDNRADSLGQIANYQLGYSYIRTKNKIAAMQAFKDAAMVKFDPAIKEDAYFNYAKLAFDLNHDPSAFNEYLANYPEKKKGDSIYSYIALANLYSHDYASAVAAYDKVEELSEDMAGNYMRANFLRAEQLIEMKAWSDAIPCLKAATFFSKKSDPFYRLARYWQAQAYFNTEKYKDAQNILNDLYNVSALDVLPEGKLISYDMAYCYFMQRDYTTAELWFNRYLDSFDTQARKDALERKADCDFMRQNYTEAIISYKKVLDEYSNPNDIYPYYRMGLAYGLNGDQKMKSSTLEPVLGAVPESEYYSEALFELGRSYVARKKENDAVKCFTRLKELSLDPEYKGRALIELGMIARNHRKYDEALKYFKEAVGNHDSEDSYQNALTAIESIYQSMGKPDLYIEYTEGLGLKEIKSEAQKAELYYNSAEQVFLAGNYEKAINNLEKFIADYPGDANISKAYFYLAESYRISGKKEKACDAYAKVLLSEENGSFAESSMLNYAALSFSLERYSDAYKGYSKLLEAAMIENNKLSARIGMFRSAYRAHDYMNAVAAASAAMEDEHINDDFKREAEYVKAKSYLAMSYREEAFAIFRELAKQASTDEGAEANYMLIQETYDKGDFSAVEAMVYDFSEKAGSQSYWLAKSFIVLGDSFVERDNIKQARQTFQSLLDGYKPSEGGDDEVLDAVRMRIEKLNNMSE